MAVLASVRREMGALWSGGRGRSLTVIAGSWGVLIGTRAVYPVLLPHLRAEFDLSLTVAGLLVTVLWLGSSVGQLPGGILADRYSERVVMAGSTIVVALALVSVLVAPTALVLFAATAFVGLGVSLYPIARMTMLSTIYPDRIGSALGVTMATGDLAQTLMPPVAAALAAALAWRAGLGFVVPLLALACIVLWVMVPTRPPADGTARTFSLERVRDLSTELRQPNILIVSLGLFLYIFVWQSFTALYPTYLVEVKGLSSSVAGVLFSLFFAVGIVVKPLSGVGYDRIGLRRSLLLVLVGPVVGLLALPFVGGFWPLVGVTALVSTMLGSGAVTQSFLTDVFSDATRGTGLGVVRTTTATLASGGPLLLGSVADRGYFDEGYVLLAVVVAAIVLVTLRLPRDA